MPIEREHWQIATPPGGWQYPWPVAAEILTALPHTSWTLVGGLMVQLQAAHAGIPLVRPTVDVDLVLHIETGATTFPRARRALEDIGFTLHFPPGGTVVHRFLRGRDQIDVMIADHPAPRVRPSLVQGRPVFAVPGGTAALQRTVNCTVEIGAESHRVSVPNTVAALVLKGAAYRADRNHGERHLDDGALLAAAVADLPGAVATLRGSDRRRLRFLWRDLKSPHHTAWQLLPEPWRQRGYRTLAQLTRNPDTSTDAGQLGW